MKMHNKLSWSIIQKYPSSLIFSYYWNCVRVIQDMKKFNTHRESKTQYNHYNIPADRVLGCGNHNVEKLTRSNAQSADTQLMTTVTSKFLPGLAILLIVLIIVLVVIVMGGRGWLPPHAAQDILHHSMSIRTR